MEQRRTEEGEKREESKSIPPSVQNDVLWKGKMLTSACALPHSTEQNASPSPRSACMGHCLTPVRFGENVFNSPHSEVPERFVEASWYTDVFKVWWGEDDLMA